MKCMNKYLKHTLFIVIILMIIIAAFMLWPLSLREVLKNSSDMTVSLTSEQTFSNKEDLAKTSNQKNSFSLQVNSVEYRKIMEILEDYSYHCNWNSFIPYRSFTGKGETLILYTGNNGFIIDAETGKVFVDKENEEHIYRVDYFGHRQTKQLASRIKEVLTQSGYELSD